MAKKSKGPIYRNYTETANLLGKDLGNFSKLIKSGRVKGEERQVYIKDEEGVFHQVGEQKIKVVNTSTIDASLKP